MSDFLQVFAGWNVWTVWQVKDLGDLNPLTWGLSRDRRLRIWIEDGLRLHGIDVAGSLDLKGDQIEILPSVPGDLSVSKRKEEIGGASALIVNGPADLRVVRFFNHGKSAPLPWLHDEEYLLETVLTPSASSPATSGPPPSTVADAVLPGAATVAAGAKLFTYAAIGVGVLVALNFWAASRGK